jgi:hypothetical protein
MSRTYRKPEEYHIWDNSDAYSKYRAGWYIRRRKFFSGKWEYYSYEEIYEEAKEDYNSWGRDGALRRGSRCKEFSDLCARDLRNANKEYIARGKWDDEMPPDRKNGKKFIWAVW